MSEYAAEIGRNGCDPRGDMAWTDRQRPPDLFGVEMTDHGDGVWSMWPSEERPLHLWHWCANTWPEGTDERRAEAAGQGPKWVLATTESPVTLRDPLSLAQAVRWPECCGLYGALIVGSWMSFE